MIRWISNSRVALQRLGFCKIAVALGDRSRSRREMAELIYPILSKPITPGADDELGKWVRANTRTRDTLEQKFGMSIVAQDLWVYSHPSRTGRLSEGAFQEYFEDTNLPFLLGFLDEECRRTDNGELLANAASLPSEELTTWDPTVNPLLLSYEEKAVFLYALMKTDGDFLIPFVAMLLETFRDSPFSYVQAGNYLPRIIEEILSRFQNALFTSSDREQYEDLQETRNKIIQNIERNIEAEGFGSRREQTTVPRLEWLVDLGALTKRGGEKYTYCFVPDRVPLVRELYNAYVEMTKEGYANEALDKLLDRKAMGILFLLHNRSTSGVLSVPDVIGYVRETYERIKPATGYCVLRPLLILSNLRSWKTGGPRVLEFREAIAKLEQAYRTDQSQFYFTTARFGEDYQIKFENRK